MTPVIRAEAATGLRYELNTAPPDVPTARRMAARAARLLGAVGSPVRWAGAKLTVTDASDGRLIAVARVRVSSRRIHDAEVYDNSSPALSGEPDDR